MRTLPLIALVGFVFNPFGASASAQPLGTFTWQLQPFCNRVTVSVRQDGAVYTLDGTDDQCGAAQKAPLVGLAAPNPDGSIGFGLNIVAPSGQASPVQARISIATLSGTWRDSGGNTGAFVFGGAAAGSPRPTTSAPGDITGVAAGTGLTGGGVAGDVSLAVDSSVVQSRVTTACPAGQALRSINQNGSATCEPITGSAGGDITAVNAGVGLTGGGTTGDVTLATIFGGDGAANASARADHEHVSAVATSVAVGPSALLLNTAAQNTALGADAGRSMTSNINNTAVGFAALRDTTGGLNTGVGSNAAGQVTTGSANTAVGFGALANGFGASQNVAIGRSALVQGTANNNTAVGDSALFSATAGAGNTALGHRSLFGLTTGTSNTGLGAGTALGTPTLVNATAIGANAQVDLSHALVLGSVQGVNGATSDTRIGVGTTLPGAALDVDSQEGIGSLRLTRYTNILSEGARLEARAARGTRAAPAALQAGDNLLFVIGQGFDGNAFTLTDRAFLVAEATENWTPTSTGTRWKFATTPNGSAARLERLVIDHDGEVGIGTANPQARLHVAGIIRPDTLGTAGATPLCRNASNEIATCSSSLRYKTDVGAFTPGLAIVNRLEPIAYSWKTDGAPDVGFAAEAVAAIDPRLATFNDEGQVEGVKYDRLTTVLVNAIKELQERNAALERRLAELERKSGASPR